MTDLGTLDRRFGCARFDRGQGRFVDSLCQRHGLERLGNDEFAEGVQPSRCGPYAVQIECTKKSPSRRPTFSASAGGLVASSATITVSGDVYLFDEIPGGSFTTEISSNDPGFSEGDYKALKQQDALVDLTLLGDPVIGKDGVDYNDDLEDGITVQCIVENDARERIVGEITCTNPVSGGPTWVELTPNPDSPETRSKLLIRTGDVEATGSAGTPLIDGKMATHTLSGPERYGHDLRRPQGRRRERFVRHRSEFQHDHHARGHRGLPRLVGRP